MGIDMRVSRERMYDPAKADKGLDRELRSAVPSSMPDCNLVPCYNHFSSWTGPESYAFQRRDMNIKDKDRGLTR